MDCCVTNEPKRRFLGQESRHGLAGSSGPACLQTSVKVSLGMQSSTGSRREESIPNGIHKAVGEQQVLTET